MVGKIRERLSDPAHTAESCATQRRSVAMHSNGLKQATAGLRHAQLMINRSFGFA